MNIETLNKLNDAELVQMIAAAQGLLKSRDEKRRSDAMEQIRQIAANAQIIVSFDAARKPKGGKPVLRAGDRFINPADATQSYVVGKGKPPQWFAALRDRNKLPAPVADPAKPKET